ncbi:MAG: rane-fusion protein [Betaproteobacteria bacterium]|nr:rane-fusion protein [Betaproteobacteria bacterium]
MRTAKAVLFLLAAAVVIGGVWLAFQNSGRSGESKAQAAAPAHLNARELRFSADSPQLSYIKAEPVEALPEPLLDPLSARIAYDENHTARISSPIAGRVTRILAQPGDRVAARQQLLQIDAPDFASAAADVAKSDADLQLKQKAFARSRELYDAQVIARKDFDTAQSELQQSEAEHKRATVRLRNLDPGAGEAHGNYVLRASIAGIVTERSVNPGSEVRPDAPNPLFVITDPAHLWVIVDLPERSLGALRAGQGVDVEVDAYPNRRFPARVAAVGEVLDPATRRVQVRCVLDNPERLLKPEMYARVTPLADTRAKLPRIPNSALLTVGLYSFVFVEKEPRLFERRQVTLGLQGRSESYVKQGLADGERVVTAGALLLNSELAGVE